MKEFDMIKLFKSIIIILFLISCEYNNKVPDKFKKDLLDFNIYEWDGTVKDTSQGKSIEFGMLWSGFNKINTYLIGDTLFINVNTPLSKPLIYDGGCEYLKDTLFLYAKKLENKESKDTVHSNLYYKIFVKGRTYKEIEFKELK